MIGIAAAGFLAVLGIVVHLVTIMAVALRLRPRARCPLPDPPSVSLVRPVCGLDYRLDETLATTFALTYPRLEVLFCAEDEDDPAVPVVRSLVAAHPAVRARLLIGHDPISGNPKLNNVAKGWREASGEWVVFSDCNTLLPPDHVERLLAVVRPDSGMVTTATVGIDPHGFAAALECAFLNPLQTRWAHMAELIGNGYALGKTLAWPRTVLEALGGLAMLGREPAEDIAATMALRRAGLRARLAEPVRQPIGRRSLAEVWRRQLRWGRLRRTSLHGVFALDPLSGGFVPMACAAAVVLAGAMPGWAFAAYAAAWYGAEAALCRSAGWPLSWRTPFAAILRDLLIPAMWVASWFGDQITWRGTSVPTRSRS